MAEVAASTAFVCNTMYTSLAVNDVMRTGAANNFVTMFGRGCPRRGLQKNINVCNIAPLHGNL